MSDRKSRRGMRDEAGVGPNPDASRRLNPMGDLPDYKIADGEPDIRGWSVYTSTGRELGEVEDLLVDTNVGEVVMLNIDLKRDDKHTLAPIKAAWIDREHRRVVLNTTMFEMSEDLSDVRAMSDVEVERAVVADLPPRSPAETERLRQESGDLTHDARDTLLNPRPNDERR